MFIASTASAQERFFEFLPGWRNLKIIEKEFVYLSIGFTSDGTGFNHYQFSSISKTGGGLNAWEFDLDTALSIESRFTNDFSTGDQINYVSGGLVGNNNRIYGSFIEFNDEFTDTVRFTSFNILPGNGTMIRTHLHINPNKFILGGFLQNTDLQVYPSLMESDSLGNINWRSDFFCGSNCDLYPFHIMQTSDGGYFFTCSELHNWGGSQVGDARKTAIIKTDSLGNEQFRLHPGNPNLYTVNGWVLPTSDGNYITAYSDPMTTDPESTPQANPQSTIWLEKFDVLGNQISIVDYFDFLPKLPNQNGLLYTIVQMLITNDSNILIVGYLDGVNDTGFMLKISQDGDPLWFRFISPPQVDGNSAGAEWTKIRGITATSDGGYIMAGEYFSSPGNIFPVGIQTAFAAKVDEFGFWSLVAR